MAEQTVVPGVAWFDLLHGRFTEEAAVPQHGGDRSRLAGDGGQGRHQFLLQNLDEALGENPVPQIERQQQRPVAVDVDAAWTHATPIDRHAVSFEQYLKNRLGISLKDRWQGEAGRKMTALNRYKSTWKISICCNSAL